MNQYVVYSKNLDDGFEKEITKKQFEELTKSKEIFVEVLMREKIYNIILMNYYEFEKESFEIKFKLDDSYFNEYQSKIEQRILNLLSSVTLYLDSFRDDLKENKKYSTHLKFEFKNIVDYLNKIRTNDKEIKIMKFLRNHIQHNGLLITKFSINSTKSSKFEIDKSTIKARGFNIDDFINLDDKIDLKKAIRVYMGHISQVHHTFREETKQKVQDARTEYEKIFQEFPEYQYLYIAQKLNNEKIDEIQISLNWDDVRLEMVKKNMVPKVFSDTL